MCNDYCHHNETSYLLDKRMIHPAECQHNKANASDTESVIFIIKLINSY